MAFFGANLQSEIIIPETTLEARESCSMQEMDVKDNSYSVHDFKKEQRNGHSAKVIVRQNGQKWPFWG